MSATVKVGWIGLGLIGKPMARRLLDAGYPLTLWNRTPSKAEDLVRSGARLAATPRDAAAAADVLFTCVSDPPALEAVLWGPDGALSGLRSGSVLVFFSAVASGFGLISSYAGFFESIDLIRDHATLLLERFMMQQYGGEFDVKVEAKFPAQPSWPSDDSWRWLREAFGPKEAEVLRRAASVPRPGEQPPRRDGFFWFLLLLDLLLAATVTALVAGAVIKTYFP